MSCPAIAASRSCAATVSGSVPAAAPARLAPQHINTRTSIPLTRAVIAAARAMCGTWEALGGRKGARILRKAAPRAPCRTAGGTAGSARCSAQAGSRGELPLLRQFADRQWGRQVKALREIHPDAFELRKHRRALDTLGHGSNPERAPDLADRLDHAAVDRILGDVADELPIDLQEVHRQGLQVHERGDAGAEIIERKAAPAALQLAHEVA